MTPTCHVPPLQGHELPPAGARVASSHMQDAGLWLVAHRAGVVVSVPVHHIAHTCYPTHQRQCDQQEQGGGPLARVAWVAWVAWVAQDAQGHTFPRCQRPEMEVCWCAGVLGWPDAVRCTLALDLALELKDGQQMRAVNRSRSPLQSAVDVCPVWIYPISTLGIMGRLQPFLGFRD
jgi:hypothetical protein